jgi:hypothetical protein
MQKKNQDPVAECTKALAAAAKALEVVASLAPPINANNQLALELDQQLAQELGQELPQNPVSGARKRKRGLATATGVATRSNGRKRQRKH